MRKNSILLTSLLIAVASPLPTLAHDRVAYQNNGLSLNATLGSLSGEAHEYVYEENTGKKISQLDWKIKNALIAKAELNYDVRSWLSINGKGWTTLAKSNGRMDDYDWLNAAQSQWSDWSHHNNTNLNYANGLDLNLRTWFLQDQNYKLGLLGGYEESKFSFRAKGGCYQYDNGRHSGCFPADEPGIGYRQTFNTPYVGLAGQYAINNFELGLLVKLSNWVKAKDNDKHYSRNLTFKEWGDNAKYHSVTLNAGYHFTKNTKLFAEASYSHYGNVKADTEITNGYTGRRSYFSKAAGLDNNNYAVALGLQYTFN
ncbi:pla plasminogen activator [Legionella beliardensis]|uniref:Pla plasminogen activator n=1 Tax=Legionella beliardensis TaxID=91822 RepID=A0A378HXZ7_9GAMM|nr:omptin family outer membrane protease [Legionella beliardensis]STX27682.1 pla plasminogen activator [Legionella beliardensis]